MELFLDTSSIKTIEEYAWLVDGVTTNPSLVAKEKMNMKDALSEISKLVSGPISIEVVSERSDEMFEEALEYVKISSHAVIKLPITNDGLKACRRLSKEGIPTNLTLCFSVSQALLAAKCGATYVSPFVGRIDDIGGSGVRLVEDICKIFKENFNTKVLAASIRNLNHVTGCALVGADAITVPVDILKNMAHHHLTDAGLLKFKNDYLAAKLTSQI